DAGRPLQRALGCLDDVEERHVGGVTGEGVAAVGPGHRDEQALPYEVREDLREIAFRDVHLRGDLARLPASLSVVPGQVKDGADGVVAFPSQRYLHGATSMLGP